VIAKNLTQWYAADFGVDLDVAEREIVLTYVLKILSDAGILQQLAFKGGTAIRKLYVSGSGRFSLDLDFTALGALDPESLILEVVGCLHDQIHYGLTFSVQPSNYYARSDSCGAEVTYHHAWATNGKFGLQVSFRAAPFLPVRPVQLRHERYFEWLGFPVPAIPALDLHEVIGEKIRAASQRSRVRDLYDLYQLAGQRFNRDIVRRIAVLKCWETRSTFDPRTFFESIREGNYNWPDLQRLVRRGGQVDPSKIIAGVERSYRFLEALDSNERILAQDAYKREEPRYQHLVGNLIDTFARWSS
jgi:predicted nucleotidyltransferase component of viral defense system